MIKFLMNNISYILISLFSLSLFPCNASGWTAKTWSAGVIINVDDQSSTLQPLNFDGRGSQTLISGHSEGVFFCNVPIYYSELVSGKTLWSQQALLRPSDQPYSTVNSFGNAHDIDGDTIIVGSQTDSTHSANAGAAYVFQGSWTKWSQQQILHVEDPTTNGRQFGNQVRIYKDFALISAFHDDDKGSFAGSVYVFVAEGDLPSKSRALFEPDEIEPPSKPLPDLPPKIVPVAKLPSTKKPTFYPTVAPIQIIPDRSSWTQLQKLVAKDISDDDNFGYKVAVSEGTAVISAPGQNYNAGVVYVFTLNENSATWSQQQKIILPVSSADYLIGSSFDIYENTIIIGSSNDDPTYNQLAVGAVYVYKYNSAKSKYTLQETLRAADPLTHGYFGSNVAIYDNVIFAGRAGYYSDSIEGATYIFTYNGKSWSQQQELSDPKGLILQSFSNPYIYGMSAFVTDSQPNAYYYTGDFNWSCVVVSLGDQFGDGWDNAKLVITAPDGTSDTYAPYCDSRNPFQFRYCPTLPSDAGVYTFSIPNAPKSKYFWEIYWTVTEESTGKVHYGDHATQLSFDFNTAKLGFDLYSSLHEVHNRTTCPVCPGKPQPKPGPKTTPLPPKETVTRPFPVITAVPPVKAGPVAASATIAAPKVFKSRKLLTDTPSGIPTTSPTPSPTAEPTADPTAEPTAEPTAFPSIFPTYTPTAWPSFNGSASRDWHWLTLYDMGADGWYEEDNSGGAYYISDVNGRKLISTGTLCPGHISSKCWQTLLDGKYVLRVGGGLDADSGDHEWSFCGKTGSSQYQLLFEIQGGRCVPLQSFSKNQFCSEKLDPLIKFAGTILLQGMASDVELASGDSVVLDHLIKSISTIFDEANVNIGNMYYSESLSGHVVEFSVDVSKDKTGYDGRDYAQVEVLQELLNDELSTTFTGGKFLSNLVGYSQISTSDSDVFNDVTQATLLSFTVSDIDFKTRVVNSDMPLEDELILTSSHHSSHSYTASDFLASTSGIITMVSVICGLIIFMALAVVSVMHRRKTVIFSALPTSSPPTVTSEHFITRRMKMLSANDEEDLNLDNGDDNTEGYVNTNNLNDSMLEDPMSGVVMKEPYESMSYNFFERNNIEDYTKSTNKSTTPTPKKKLSFASPPTTTTKMATSQSVNYGYDNATSIPMVPPTRYSTSPTAIAHHQEPATTATGTTNYSSSVFLVGVPVKSANGATGQMAFNTSSMLTDREEPVDLWSGMKDLAKDEDALLNSMHNLY